MSGCRCLPTAEPGVRSYSGNALDGSNRPAFPSAVLRPGEHDRSRTARRFGAG